VALNLLKNGPVQFSDETHVHNALNMKRDEPHVREH